LRILLINTYGAPLHDLTLPGVFGGVEVDLYMLARLFQRFGHDVHVLVQTLGGEESRETEGLHLHALWPDGRPWRSPFHLWRLARRLDGLGPQVLVSELVSDYSAVAGWLARRCGLPMIYRAANKRDWLLVAEPGRYNWKERLRFRLTLAGTSCYVAQTAEQAQVLGRVFPAERLRVIPNFHLPQDADLPDFGQRRGILWVGHLTRVKQPLRVARLAELLPEVPFLVIASTVPHSEEAGSRAALQALPNVTLLESVPFALIQRHYNQARILLNTSLSEGFPNTFIHAMNGGTPLASVEVDPDGILSLGGCGPLEGKLERLAEDLRRLHDDPAVWLATQERLLAYREEHFAFAPIEAAYREVLERCGA
jgi:glycosyltransferase involved in cell wall biosynthesis